MKVKSHRLAPMGFFLPPAGLQQAAVVLVRLHAVRREELVDGEVDAAEHRARIVLGRALARFVRHAVVVRRDEQLRVALKPDDRKLPQRHVQLLAAAGQREFLAHGIEDLLRDGARLLLGLHGAAAVHQLHVQSDRVDGFYYPHQIGKAIKVYPNHRAFSGLYAHFRPY